jgi:hypothetical protein
MILNWQIIIYHQRDESNIEKYCEDGGSKHVSRKNFGSLTGPLCLLMSDFEK